VCFAAGLGETVVGLQPIAFATQLCGVSRGEFVTRREEDLVTEALEQRSPALVANPTTTAASRCCRRPFLWLRPVERRLRPLLGSQRQRTTGDRHDGFGEPRCHAVAGRPSVSLSARRLQHSLRYHPTGGRLLLGRWRLGSIGKRALRPQRRRVQNPVGDVE
jgi:hypothetical protein